MLLLFLVKGIVVGVVIAVPVGPVGILCLRRTIFEGQLSGLVSGLGAATADALFGVAAAFGLTLVSRWLISWEDWLRAGGGIYLLYSGGSALFSKAHEKMTEESDTETLVRGFASAFALTITNPGDDPGLPGDFRGSRARRHAGGAAPRGVSSARSVDRVVLVVAGTELGGRHVSPFDRAASPRLGQPRLGRHPVRDRVSAARHDHGRASELTAEEDAAMVYLPPGFTEARPEVF
jgi:LysE type translocator